MQTYFTQHWQEEKASISWKPWIFDLDLCRTFLCTVLHFSFKHTYLNKKKIIIHVQDLSSWIFEVFVIVVMMLLYGYYIPGCTAAIFLMVPNWTLSLLLSRKQPVVRAHPLSLLFYDTSKCMLPWVSRYWIWEYPIILIIILSYLFYTQQKNKLQWFLHVVTVTSRLKNKQKWN